MRGRFCSGVLLAVALACGPALLAQQAMRPRSVDLAVTYSAERAKIASIDCGCFWLQGGSVSGSVPLFRGLSVAANFTAEHASNITPGVDLGTLAVMAGPRYTLNTRRWTDRWLGYKREVSLFGEGLFGFAHGFDGSFPVTSGIETSANTFSLQLGGGLNIGLSKHFGLRALEVDFVRTNFPNTLGDAQNDLRLAFGITYRPGRNGGVGRSKN
jgi:outer membrane immunogenic protein